MAGQFPKGADLLAAIRKQGYRPSATVMVFLDADRPHKKIYADLPLTVEVCIRPTDDIGGLEFWPLADLDIAIHGGAAMNDRLREVLRAITKVCPRFLTGGVPAERLIFAWHPQRGWEYAHV